jgi:hypothetical protein
MPMATLTRIASNQAAQIAEFINDADLVGLLKKSTLRTSTTR